MYSWILAACWAFGGAFTPQPAYLMSSPSSPRTVTSSGFLSRRVSPSRMTVEEKRNLPAKPLSELEKAMGSLPKDVQYNAVLESLLSRLDAAEQMEEPLELIREMSSRRIKVSSEGLAKMVDVAFGANDLVLLLKCIQEARLNGASSAFGTNNAKLQTVSPDQAVRQRVLSKLEAAPQDPDKGLQVTVAVLFTGVCAAILGLEVTNPIFHFGAPPLPLVFLLGAGAYGFDRYSAGGSNAQLLSLGLQRLFQRDTEREATCESASFLLGYLLGLPWMAYGVNAERAAAMAKKKENVEMQEQMELMAGSSPLASCLEDRILVWMLAPVAAEKGGYQDLLLSDTDAPQRFLQSVKGGVAEANQGVWSEADEALRINWAYNEAKRLLQKYKGMQDQLRKQMADGAATMGQCVALIESNVK